MRKLFAVVLLALALFTGLAFAQDETSIGFRGWGPRVGATLNPDQFHFGAHLDFGQFANHFRFQPNVELGIGDGSTLAALNLETNYRINSTWESWSPYIGGGVGVNFVGSEDKGLTGNDTDTQLGLNVMGGLERGLDNGDRFFGEAKVGFADSPDLKLTVGWTFFH
ncbi:MAG: hypothetical protein ACE15D_17675 [Candidatus Eisenbacteria bacterium]|nr:hypothetical protein [Candidatus Eisenbacteria bacterium]